MLLSLDEIGLKHGTDKSSLHHDYLNFYEFQFAPLRQRKLSILEIGVFRGQSLLTWAEYFPSARIVGVDIADDTKRFADDRVKIEIADQSNVQQMTDIGRRHGPFDIVIEDGSHMCEHQITTLRTVFPFVRNGGFYVVEDLQTNYGAMLEKYRGIASITCVEYLKKWLDLRVGDSEIDIGGIEDAFLRTYGRSIAFMTFYRHACLIKKGAISTWDVPVVNDDAWRARAQPVNILAHFSSIGDVEQVDVAGCEGRAKAFELQGVSLSSGPGALEYKVRFPDGSWSGWVDEGTFVGSRGRSEYLRGIAVRISEKSACDYAVRTSCRFAGGTPLVVGIDGEEVCIETAEPLCAVQLDLVRRAGA